MKLSFLATSKANLPKGAFPGVSQRNLGIDAPLSAQVAVARGWDCCTESSGRLAAPHGRFRRLPSLASFTACSDLRLTGSPQTWKVLVSKLTWGFP